MRTTRQPEWLDTINTPERRIFDLRSIGMRHALALGSLHYNRASKPLAEQCHDHWMVLIFLLSGRQRYLVDGTEAWVRGGETLVILPGQRYGTGEWPEQKGELAWLIVKVRPLPRGAALGMSGGGVRKVLAMLADPIRPRISPSAPDLPGLLDSISRRWDTRHEELSREIIRNRVSSIILGAAAGGDHGDHGDVANRLRIERVHQWTSQHLDKGISTADMARVAGLSSVGFHHHFKQLTGCSPKDWLMRKRVERAAERLRAEPEASVTSLAHELGFSSSQYFATVFRRYLGASPGDYRSSAP